MKEFIIIDKTQTEAQKCMNQWRHEYELDIISVQASQNKGQVIIALWRTKK